MSLRDVYNDLDDLVVRLDDLIGVAANLESECSALRRSMVKETDRMSTILTNLASTIEQINKEEN